MAKKERSEAISHTILGVVAITAVLSLVLLFSSAFNAAGKLSLIAKFSPGEVVQLSECNFPKDINDLVAWRSRRKNVPVLLEGCPWLAQEYCINQNSGKCLQQCLAREQSPQGICQGTGFSITAQVVLNFEECKRLASSFAQSSKDALTTVGAVPKTTEQLNPCTEETESARSRTYTLTEPVQAYARNEFERGDVTGLYANEQKNINSLEYTLCADGRATVTIEGDKRCSTMD